MSDDGRETATAQDDEETIMTRENNEETTATRGDEAETATARAREVARTAVEAGIDAARPERAVAASVSLSDSVLRVAGTAYDLADYEEVVVVGGGKAAGGLAAALEDVLGDRISRGAVVTTDPPATGTVETHRGSHPVPDERTVAGTRRVLEVAESAGADSLVLVVVTGGGSALLTAPAVPLAALQSLTEALLASGAPVEVLNVFRKHLSEIKGGRLARVLAPADVVGLVMSDVVGNDTSVVASGPVAPDSSTFGEALDAADTYDLDLPTPVREHLAAGAAGDVPETPTAGDPAFERVDLYVVADATTALRGAARAVERRGYEPLVLTSRDRGEAREVAKPLVGVAEEMVATGTPVESPAAVLVGGEVTVTVTGDGTGGPNQELAVSAAVELDVPGVAVASVDTDGRDGGTDVAGGLVDATTVDDEGAAMAALADNDARRVLEASDAAVRTGPTGTNVNDLRVVVVDGAAGGDGDGK